MFKDIITVYYSDFIFYNLVKLINPRYIFFDVISNPVCNNDINLPDFMGSLISADSILYSCIYLQHIIYNKIKDKNKKIYYISNGVNFDLFNGYLKTNTYRKKPTELQGLVNPIIGFYGCIDANIDFNLINLIADIDDLHVVIISNIQEDFISELNHPNITLITYKSCNELPQYLTYFRACLLPYKNTTTTKAANPLKLYEYLCSGKPILYSGIYIYDDFIRENCFEIDISNYKRILTSFLTKNNNVNNPMIRYTENFDWKKIVMPIVSIMNDDISTDNIRITFLILSPIRYNLINRFSNIAKHISLLRKDILVIYVYDNYDGVELYEDNLLVINKNTFENNITNYLVSKLVVMYSDCKYDNYLSELGVSKFVFDIDNSDHIDVANSLKTYSIITASTQSICNMLKSNGVKNKLIYLPNGIDNNYLNHQTMCSKLDTYKLVCVWLHNVSDVDWKLIELLAVSGKFMIFVLFVNSGVSDFIDHKQIVYYDVSNWNYQMLCDLLKIVDIGLIPYRFMDSDVFKNHLLLYGSLDIPVISVYDNNNNNYSDYYVYIDNRYDDDVVRYILKNIFVCKDTHFKQMIEDNSWEKIIKKFVELVFG